MRNLVLSVWTGPGGLSDEAPLLAGGVDAADLRTLATLVEEQFIIDVHEEEIDATHFGTVTRLAHFVNAKLTQLQTCRRGASGTWHDDAPPISCDLVSPSSRDPDDFQNSTESAA
ncbi:hypothetical protein [Chondromyces crocatus]|uniref:hypothetical protein n=1 Tax=Chondromyces crocatus TaxID=52 RepID=UPI00067DBFD7|nr:hypothetical protein [Chondromyces crocatus]